MGRQVLVHLVVVVDGRYKSDVVAWIDRGAGFVKGPAWSDQVMHHWALTRPQAVAGNFGRTGWVPSGAPCSTPMTIAVGIPRLADVG